MGKRPSHNGTALAYVRMSSLANAGEEKDSEPRQKYAIEAYAVVAGLEVVKWFRDAGVSGAESVCDRPGFSSMLDYARATGVKRILFEDRRRQPQ